MMWYIIPRGTLVQPILCNNLESNDSVTLNRDVVLNETNCAAYFKNKLNEALLSFYMFDFTIGIYKGFWYFVTDVTVEKL